MFVLFDNGTPRTLARSLIGRHTVTEARARGIRYQQNLTGQQIGIVVLGKGRWSIIKSYLARVVAAVDHATPGSFAEVEMPDPSDAADEPSNGGGSSVS